VISDESIARAEALFREGRKTVAEVDKLVTLATDPSAYPGERAIAAAEACRRIRAAKLLPNLVKLGDWLEQHRESIVRAVKMASTVQDARASGVGKVIESFLRR
jgi:hypothetical protein